MDEYEVLEIYRELVPGGAYDLKMFLFNGRRIVVKRVSDRMKLRVRRGMCYKHDWVRARDGDDGITFEIIEPRSYSYLSLYGKEFDSDAYLTVGGPSPPAPASEAPGEPLVDHSGLPGKILLPLLNDTLPYSDLETPAAVDSPPGTLRLDPDGVYMVGQQQYSSVDRWYRHKCKMAPIVGRVAYKTRMGPVTHSRRHPYYFFILQTSEKHAVKVFVWGEDLPYSSIRVGDVVGLPKYRKKPAIEGPSVVEHNRFTEAAYFCCREVSAREMLRIEAKDVWALPKPIFHEACGRLEYLSVLTRRHAGQLEEYYLLRLGGYRVLLFYNSSKEFYRMEVGKHLRITNLRVCRRGASEFHVSTIYTQIEPQDTAVPRTRPNPVDFPERRLGGGEAGRRGQMVDFEESSSDGGPPEDKGPVQCSLVSGAVGYVPDDFASVEEMYVSHKTQVSGRVYEAVAFMPPQEIGLKEIHAEVEKLVLNESRKYLVEAILVDVDFSNFVFDEPPTLADGTSVSYFSNGARLVQQPGYMSICNEVTVVVYLFSNFWMDGFDLEGLYRLAGCTSLSGLKAMRGRVMRFVIDAFRASEETVVLCLTKAFG